MNLLPKPKRVEPGQGTFAFGISTAIRLTFGAAPGALLYAQMLQQTLEAETGLHCAILRGAARDGMVNLEIDPAQQAARYTLTVTPAAGHGRGRRRRGAVQRRPDAAPAYRGRRRGAAGPAN